MAETRAGEPVGRRRARVLQVFSDLFPIAEPSACLLWLCEPDHKGLSFSLAASSTSRGEQNWIVPYVQPRPTAPVATREAVTGALSILTGRPAHPDILAYVRAAGLREIRGELILPLEDIGGMSERPGVAGYIQIVSEARAPRTFPLALHDQAASMFAWWISHERRGRVLAALGRAQGAVASSGDFTALADHFASVAREATNAIECRIYIAEAGGVLRQIATSSSTKGPPLFLRGPSLNALILQLDFDQAVRFADVRSSDSRDLVLGSPSTLQAIEISAGERVPLSWLSAIGRVRGADASPLPHFIFTLLNDKREDHLAATFSPNNALLAQILASYLADLAPALLTQEAISRAAATFSAIQSEFRTRVTKVDFLARDFEICRLIREVLPCVAKCYVVKGATSSGERDVFYDAVRREPDADQGDFHWGYAKEIDRPHHAFVHQNAGWQSLDMTIFATQVHKRGIRIQMNRWPLAKYEYEIVSHIADELRAVSLAEYAVDDNMVQIAEVRHALRAGLTSVISHLNAALGIYRDAVDIARGGDDQTVRRILLDQATFRKSMERAQLAGEQVWSFFEDSRLLLADMTAASLQSSTVDIVEMAREIRALYLPERQRRRVEIELIVDPSAVNDAVVGDQKLLRLALFNLIDNAVKYSFTGNTVHLRIRADRRGFTVEVENTGRYIHPGSREDIFVPFRRVRADPGVQEMSGTGLGLAVTRRIAELHGGSVRFESHLLDAGGSAVRALTTFYLQVPRSRTRPT